MSENELPNQNSGCSEHPMDYLNKAAEACASGDLTLGMHLYLAAYEKAMSEPGHSTGLAVAALREAWQLACDLRERSMAEHVFEKLEPFLTGDEISECAQALQDLALDRLEEYGFSREDLQDMAEAISQDFLGNDASVVKVEHISIPNANMFGVPGQVVADVSVDVTPKRAEQSAVEQGRSDVPEPSERSTYRPMAQSAGPADVPTPHAGGSDSDAGAGRPKIGMEKADVFNPYDMYPESSVGHSWNAATNSGSGWNEGLGFDGTTVLDSRFAGFFSEKKPATEESEAFPEAIARAEELSDGRPASAPKGLSAQEASPEQSGDQASPDGSASSSQEDSAMQVDMLPVVVPDFTQMASAGEGDASGIAPASQAVPAKPQVFDYRSLVGYDEAVSIMRNYGTGLQNDQGFKSFVAMMNEQHGLDRAPSADTVLFRSPAIEDAARFVEATIGEIGLPTLRMTMEEGAQGMPVLCVTADANNRPRMNRQHNRLEGPAILVVSDLDLWRMPEPPDSMEGGMAAFVAANMTRGAREAVALIRSAVEDPDVVVLATSSVAGEVDPFFYDVLEPLTIIDIGNPNELERDAIWAEIMRNHPSMRGLDRADLVRYSAGMARYDIYMAARESIEEAYKMGLTQRTYLPVEMSNVLDKLASCQPFDSDEYRALEERVVSEFAAGLDDLASLLGDSADQGPEGA